jgi:hypothetical protein
LRESFYRLRKKLSLSDDAKAPGLLGDEHPAIGEECERPRLLESFDDLDEPKRVLVRAQSLGERAERQRGDERDQQADEHAFIPAG